MVRIARIADTDTVQIRKLDFPTKSTGMDFSGVIRYIFAPSRSQQERDPRRTYPS
ncbi:MAG: hypothetical protein OJF50_003224 [Nitrospira sp.]|nr:hypothetical protein [Nitrospira sp.]